MVKRGVMGPHSEAVAVDAAEEGEAIEVGEAEATISTVEAGRLKGKRKVVLPNLPLRLRPSSLLCLSHLRQNQEMPRRSRNQRLLWHLLRRHQRHQAPGLIKSINQKISILYDYSYHRNSRIVS
jgi:hypothetical protein